MEDINGNLVPLAKIKPMRPGEPEKPQQITKHLAVCVVCDCRTHVASLPASHHSADYEMPVQL